MSWEETIKHTKQIRKELPRSFSLRPNDEITLWIIEQSEKYNVSTNQVCIAIINEAMLAEKYQSLKKNINQGLRPEGQ